MRIRRHRGTTVLLQPVGLLLTILNCKVDGFLPRAFVQPSSQFRPPSGQATTRIHTSRRPLQEILSELEARGVDFPTTATRLELEDLLWHSEIQDEPSDVQPSTRSRQTRDLRRQDCGPGPAVSWRPSSSRNQSGPSTRIDYDSMNVVPRDRETRRRRRRRQEQRKKPVYTTDTLFRAVDRTSRTVAQALPEEVLGFGSKATRLASRRTQQLFDDLVDITYDDSDTTKRRSVARRRSRARGNAENDKPRFENVVEQVYSTPNTAKAVRRRRSQRQPISDDENVQSKRTPPTSPPAAEPSHQSSAKDLTSGRETNIPNLPIHEILAELDALNVRYSPSATRRNLEILLEDARRGKSGTRARGAVAHSQYESDATDHGSVVGADDGISDNDLYQDDDSTKSIWNRACRVASKKVKAVPSEIKQRTRNKANRTYEKAKSGVSGLFPNAEIAENANPDSVPIIVDAIVEDFSLAGWDDDDVIDVQPYLQTSCDSKSARRRRKARPRPTSNAAAMSSVGWEAREDVFPGRARRTRPSPGGKGDFSKYHHQEMQEVRKTGIPPRLPPTAKYSNKEDRSQAYRRNRHSSNSGRRIYSPYGRGDSGEPRMYVDGLDQIGDFVVKSVDSFLWGAEEDDAMSGKSTKRAAKGSAKAVPSAGTRRRSGHWKDRMEEQFDYFMGIHEDGTYYNRWVERELEDERNREGTDAVSYARGRSPRRGSKRRTYERPIWEDDDSLLSLLFGSDKQAKRRDQMFYQPSLFGSGSLVKILRTLIRSAVLLAGGVCRWASVRGSLPQPVVVVSALTAALSSRPGVRIRNVFLALLATRTVGEVVHGYMYDDADFWEPEESEPQT